MRLSYGSDEVLATPVDRYEERQVRIIKSLILLVVVLLAVIGVLLWDSTRTIPPCATEDSNNCYWDADTMGNGTGHDSVVLVP